MGVRSTVGSIVDPTVASTVESSKQCIQPVKSTCSPYKCSFNCRADSWSNSRINRLDRVTLSLFSACGNTVYTGQEGSITSPNHPMSYPSNANCVFRIQLSTPTVVELQFSSLFRLETSRDFVKVVSGITMY